MADTLERAAGSMQICHRFRSLLEMQPPPLGVPLGGTYGNLKAWTRDILFPAESSQAEGRVKGLPEILVFHWP